jgi:hypothetical protein
MGSPGSVGFGSRVAGFSPGSSGLRPTACRNRHGNCRISVLATVHRGSGPLGSGSSVLFRVSNSRIPRILSPRSLSLSLSNLSLSHLSRLSDLSHLCLTLSRCLFRATRRTEKKRRKKKGKRRKRRDKKKWSGCELLKRESGLIL